VKETNDNSMQDLKPTVWIGKQGCTGTMIEEIVAQLKKRNTIKVKWLQNCEVDPATVATDAKAELVSVRGRTMVLRSKKGVAKSKNPAQDTTKRPPVNRSRRNGDPVARMKRT
jgi:RNA-binding protein